MHATSTPTLAQPKPSAFGAVAAAALAVGIAAGAIAAVNLAPTTGRAAGETGSVTQIEPASSSSARVRSAPASGRPRSRRSADAIRWPTGTNTR